MYVITMLVTTEQEPTRASLNALGGIVGMLGYVPVACMAEEVQTEQESIADEAQEFLRGQS